MVPIALIEIFIQLQLPESRQLGLSTLAGFVDATDAYLFGKDEEIGVFLPAQGLRQTLQHGAKWQGFLQNCTSLSPYHGMLPMHPDGSLITALGLMDALNCSIVVFLGVELDQRICEQIGALLPLVGAKLAMERSAQSAAGHAAAARNASWHARALNTALDANRKELQKAFNTAEKELANRRVAEIKLIEADRRKDEFLAMLAHELRNPLAPINLAAQMITLASSDKARIDGATQIICRQVKHITSLLNDLLDVSRVTHGKIILSNQPINLKSVVEEAIEQSRPLIDLLAHRLDVCLLPEDATISGDRTRLVQIVTNLLNNAAKYTPHGGELSAEMLIGMEHITLCIRDNGIGIDAALLPHVFELFTQAPRASDRAQGGLGIGLALVKSLVELHGGTITAHSDGLGKGCQFRLTFPRLIHKSNTDGYCAIAPSLERCDQSLSIIVVDDNIDAADALATLLEALGHRVQVAYCAQEGLKLATSVKPSAMFIDIGLPDMDGHQLAKSLRASQISEDLLLIAFTGYGQTNDQDLSRKAGFDFHFTKPADTIEITRLLHRFAQSMNRGNK